MNGKHWLVAGALVLGAALAPHATSAATLSPQSTLRTTDAHESLVQKTQYRYCRRWRHECAERWGWRTPRYFRCLARHGC
ncbi:MAG: glycosyl hydrolase family 5 [Hyphomicrobiaceae bacterium]|jgi:hypothetical protein